MSALLVVLLLAACAPVAAPAPLAPAAPAKAGWETEWEKVLAAAKQEGKVVIATTVGSEFRSALVVGIKAAYGLRAETIAGRAAEIQLKLAAERRAGLYLEDVFISATSVIVNVLKPTGMLESLDAALLLPEVTDPKLWYKGEFPWIDKDHVGIVFHIYPTRMIAINTNLVKPGEVKSWRDLLDPKWKGKLVMHDPTIAGAGQLVVLSMSVIMGKDFLYELAKAEPIIMRDERQMIEWLAQGKISVLIAPKPDTFGEFLKVGAPVATVVPVEGQTLSSGPGAIALFKNAPQPNAGKVFLNWLLTKEGQTLVSDAVLTQSARLDVPTTGFPPDSVRQPGLKYFPVYDEPALQMRLVTDKLAMEIFGPLAKR